MKKFKNSLLLLFACLICIGPVSGSEGWDLLLKNRVEEAFAAFKKAAEDPDCAIGDLEGLYQIYHLKGAPEECVAVSLRLLEKHAPTPLGLICAARVGWFRKYYDSRDQIYGTLKNILAGEELHPVTRTSIKRLLKTLEKEMCNYAAARTIAEESSLLQHWNFAVGPFDQSAPSWLSKELPPEKDLSLEAYTFEGEEVERDGFRTYTDYMGGRQRLDKDDGEVAYLVSGFETDEAREMVLACSPAGSVKAWLNRLPVFLPEETRHKRETTTNVIVKLRKGMNVLVVKTTADSISVRFLNPDYSPFKAYRPVAEIPADLLRPGIERVVGVRYSQDAPDVLADAFGTDLPSRMLQFDYLSQWNMMEKYRRLVLEELELPDKSGLKHWILAEYYNEARSDGPDSSTRMKNNYRRELDETMAYMEGLPLLLKRKATFLINNKMYKEGYALLEKALKLAPESGLLLETRLQYFEKRKWEVEQEKALESLVERSPYFLIDQYDYLRGEKRFAQAREVLDKAFKAKILSLWGYMDRLDDYDETEAVVRIAGELEALFPEDRHALMGQVGYYYYQHGDLEKAIEQFESVLAEDAENTYSLKLRAQIAFEQGDSSRALELWRRIADLGEDVPGLYRRIRQETGEDLPVLKHDIVLLDEFNERDLNPEAYPESDHVNLLDVTLLQLHADGSYEALIHNAFLAVTQNSVKDLGEIVLPSNMDRLVYCRTISRERDMFIPTSIKEAKGRKYASMPNVVPGAVVEYAYMVYGSLPDDPKDFTLGFEFGRSKEPTKRALMVVMAPRDYQLYPFNTKRKEPEITETDGSRTYVWKREDLEGLEEEQAMPPADEIIEQGSLKGRENFVDYTTRYFYDYDRFFSSRETDAKGQELCRTGKTVAEKAENCMRWIRDNIEDGDEARTLRDVFITRRGGVGVRRDLLRYWLRQDGIKSGPGYVNSQFFLREHRETGVSGLTYFGSDLIVIPGEPGRPRTWIDIDSNFHYADLFLLDGNSVNQAVIFPENGCYTLGRVKERENDLASAEYKVALKLEATGDSGVEATGHITGKLAARVRELLEDPQREKQILESLAKSILPRIQIDESLFEEKRVGEGAVVHRFNGRILGFANREEEQLSFSPFIQKIDVSGLIGKAEREYDYVLNAPRFDRFAVEFTLPEGYAASYVPERCCLTSRYGVFLADFRLTGRKLKCAVSFAVPAMRIPPHGYPRFTGFLKEVKKYLEKNVVVRKLPEGMKPVEVDAFLPVLEE